MTPIAVRLARRLMLAITRGRITLVDDTGVHQKHQVDFGPVGPDGSLSIRDNTPMIGLYGFSSNPPIGSDVIALFVGGDRANGVALGHNHQKYRLKGLNPGEVALYDQWGNTVKLTAAGFAVTDFNGNSIVSTASSLTLTHTAKIVLSAPEVDLGGTGGADVARKGDAVSGGVITGGSTTVKST